jgi:hypothetical protein
MAPPPSQKGKFKPRKPVKKIAKPGAAAAAIQPTEAPSSAAAAAYNPTNDRGGRGGRGRGADEGRGGRGRGADEGRGGRGRGRDGGRGGRGGRGRGRSPLPQGKVFFTAAAKQETGASKKRVSAATRMQNRDVDPSEEVVGQLDSAIGTSNGKGSEKKSVLDSMNDYEEMDQYAQPEPGRGGKGITLEGVFYDSDSSEEEERNKRRVRHTTVKPVELPFPVVELPLGVGAKGRPVMYDLPQTKPISSDPSLEKNDVASESDVSPFVDLIQKESLEWEQDSWFLVQLPTRLPPLQQQNVPAGPAPGSETDEPPSTEEVTSAGPIVNPDLMISEVVTPPVGLTSFDNALVNAVPGRLGKLVVYKSGKTVLVMEGPDGNKVRIR